jgi:hypothetical protein
MGDFTTSRETRQQLRNRLEDEKYARDHYFGSDSHTLPFRERSMRWMLDSNHIDSLVSQSRGNESIRRVMLVPYTYNSHDDYGVWDKVGRAVGNLQALENIWICTPNYHEHTPDWEILARILSHVRQKIKVYINHVLSWDAEGCTLLARAIRGHPTITSFGDVTYRGDYFPYEYSDALYAALATLPALESLVVSYGGRQVRPEDEHTLAHPESLTDLLRSPSLQSVCFDDFTFTSALCQATANAFMERTAITKLVFRSCNIFCGSECCYDGEWSQQKYISVTH